MSRSGASSALPTEILIEIAGHLSKTDLTVLARVSQLFKGISTPLLYRTISRILSFDADTLCRTLVHSDLAAQAVQDFHLEWLDRFPLRLARSAMLRMTSLISLHLSFTPEHILDDLFFPNLQNLNLEILKPTESYYSLIRRHRLTLRRLLVKTFSNTRNNYPLPATSLGPIPHLDYYFGGVELMSSVLPGTAASEVTIRLLPRTYEDQWFVCLNELPLKIVNTVGDTHNIPSLRSILRYAKSPVHWRHCMTDVYNEDTEMYGVGVLHNVLGMLSSMASNGGLKNLKSFIIESGQDNSLDNLLQCDWDGLQALTLGDFENLMSCELPGGLQWRRSSADTWIPNLSHEYTKHTLAKYIPGVQAYPWWPTLQLDDGLLIQEVMVFKGEVDFGGDDWA